MLTSVPCLCVCVCMAQVRGGYVRVVCASIKLCQALLLAPYYLFLSGPSDNTPINTTPAICADTDTGACDTSVIIPAAAADSGVCAREGKGNSAPVTHMPHLPAVHAATVGP